MITLVMVFGLLCNTSLWAGNGKGAGDGSMLDVNLSNSIVFTGTVSAVGTTGSGLSIDGTDDPIYGLGPIGYWNNEGVLRPEIGDNISVEAVLVGFSDGDRWIAISLTFIDSDDNDDNDVTVLLRTDEGPAWRGVSKQGGTSNASGDCTACPNSETCGNSQGGGTGTCPLVTD